MSNKASSVQKNDLWEFGGDISEAFESTDLGQAVSADVDDICEVLSNHILEKMVETYDLAGEISKGESTNHFNTFQGLLRDFKDWDSKTKKKFFRKVKRDLKDIGSLTSASIIGAAQIRFVWLAKTKGISKKECNRVLQAISISRIIPAPEDFLHWCCCHSVKDIYQHPYLFDNRKKVSKRKRQENLKDIRSIINKAIAEEIYSRDNAKYIIRSALEYVKGSPDNYSDDDVEEDEDTEVKESFKKMEITSEETPEEPLEKEHYFDETKDSEKEITLKPTPALPKEPSLKSSPDKVVDKEPKPVSKPEPKSEPKSKLKSKLKPKPKPMLKSKRVTNRKVTDVTDEEELSDNTDYSEISDLTDMTEAEDSVAISDDSASDEEFDDIDSEKEEQYWSSLRKDIKKKNNSKSDHHESSSEEESDEEEVSRLDEEDRENRSDREQSDEEDDEEEENGDEEEDDEEEEEEGQDNFWSSLRGEARKQLGYGRSEEATSEKPVKKETNKIEDTIENQLEDAIDDIEMMDPGVDDGIDLDSDEE